MEKCGICFEDAESAHSLPCSHVFCYICISRHIRIRDFCPKCFEKPFSRFDLLALCPKIHKIEIPSTSLIKRDETMKKILKKYRISLEGNGCILEKRFYSLVDILYKEQFKEKRMSNIEIAWTINNSKVNKNKSKSVDRNIIKNFIELKNEIKNRKYDKKWGAKED